MASFHKGEFPSPCGEKVGINRIYKDRGEYFIEVSVPLRGKGRDQQWEAEAYLVNGKHFLFPSPCGEKVGINGWLAAREGFVQTRFRPLAGKR